MSDAKKKQISYGTIEADAGGGDAVASTRRLKVYYGHHGNNYRRHPVIRLGGSYLKRFGFKVGDAIQVHLEQGRIQITKLARE